MRFLPFDVNRSMFVTFCLCNIYFEGVISLSPSLSLSLFLSGRKKETTSISIIKFIHLSIKAVSWYTLTLLNNITVGVFLLNLQIVYDYELYNAESIFPFNIIYT